MASTTPAAGTEEAPDRSPRSLARNVARTIAICLLVAASLATFPAAIPWMVAVWIACHTWLACRRRASWPPLIACLAILLVKRVAWPPGMMFAMATLLLAAIAGCWPQRRRLLIISNIAVCLGWLALLWDWHASATAGRPRLLDAVRPIVCIGDSLTSGESGTGYPEHLAKLVPIPVVNLGRARISTVDGVKLIPKIEAAKPQAVIIELGGHDFLKGLPREATKANLRKLIEASRRVGAEPILMEVPRGFMIDPYAGLERELAREEDLELISDSVIRQLVLWSPYAPPGMWTGGPYLSDDGLHPNESGNAELARTAHGALRRVFTASRTP